MIERVMGVRTGDTGDSDMTTTGFPQVELRDSVGAMFYRRAC